MHSETENGDVPSKRARPSGSRLSNDENETPPEAQHEAARKQRRKQQARTHSPPLRPAARRARAASPSDSGTSEEADQDAGCEQTRQQEQRAQQEQGQPEADGIDDAEDGLGIRRRGSTPDSEVQSEEDPSADEFVREEVCRPSPCLSFLQDCSERLTACSDSCTKDDLLSSLLTGCTAAAAGIRRGVRAQIAGPPRTTGLHEGACILLPYALCGAG